MKLISKSWTISFETKHELNDTENVITGVLRAKLSSVDRSIQNLCRILTKEDWEIKSVIPLISGTVFGTALLNKSGPGGIGLKSYGGGFGYGASYTEGVIVLAQKWVKEKSDESCVGTIKSDCKYKESEKPDEGELPSEQDINSEKTVTSKEPKQVSSTYTNFDDYWNERVSCSDKSCTGTIGPDGKCRECGKNWK